MPDELAAIKQRFTNDEHRTDMTMWESTRHADISTLLQAVAEARQQMAQELSRLLPSRDLSRRIRGADTIGVHPCLMCAQEDHDFSDCPRLEAIATGATDTNSQGCNVVTKADMRPDKTGLDDGPSLPGADD